MKDKAWFPMLFMFLVTAIPSAMLIGLSQYTRARIQANTQIAFEKAVLFAVAPDTDPTLRGMALHARFLQCINTNTQEAAGAYRLMDGATVKAYAIPFAGKGFWDTVRGVIAIAPDKTTVIGFYIYEQSETPGLGAEISQPWFGKQFQGKTLADGAAPLTFRRKGDPLGPHDVEAVTGGTQTSVRLEKLVNNAVATWRAAMMPASE
jgi:Na+-transporting NADH:ubiquinone oxidoreductase subunit C